MVKAIVGANWGDEGKGKITDMLAEESDIIVRFQGGSNVPMSLSIFPNILTSPFIFITPRETRLE